MPGGDDEAASPEQFVAIADELRTTVKHASRSGPELKGDFGRFVKTAPDFRLPPPPRGVRGGADSERQRVVAVSRPGQLPVIVAGFGLRLAGRTRRAYRSARGAAAFRLAGRTRAAEASASRPGRWSGSSGKGCRVKATCQRVCQRICWHFKGRLGASWWDGHRSNARIQALSEHPGVQ